MSLPLLDLKTPGDLSYTRPNPPEASALWRRCRRTIWATGRLRSRRGALTNGWSLLTWTGVLLPVVGCRIIPGHPARPLKRHSWRASDWAGGRFLSSLAARTFCTTTMPKIVVAASNGLKFFCNLCVYFRLLSMRAAAFFMVEISKASVARPHATNEYRSPSRHIAMWNSST